MFHMYLPIAGNSVNIVLILGLGGLVGLLSGIFGVGGGFLMTPLLIMFGIPPTVAAASDSNQIVGASTSGTLAHYRLGNVDMKMGILLLIGGILGGGIGVQLIKVLKAMGNADFLINVTYVIMLGGVGGYMFVESLQSLKKSSTTQANPVETASVRQSQKNICIWKNDESLAIPDGICQIRCFHVCSYSTGTWYFCRCFGCHYGCWGRIYYGPGHGLPVAYANARRRWNKPFSNPVYLYQCYYHAVIYQSYS